MDWVAGAPRSISFGDIYFSGDGLAEARHVFLGGNDLARRFAAARGAFVIGELGLGTGLNILAALDLWRRTAKPGSARLEFLSIEKHPLRADDLRRAHEAWPELHELSGPLRSAYPPIVAGVHRAVLADDVALTLVFGEAGEVLPKLVAAADAWFLDGFAPSKNPEMWGADIAAEVARLSKPGATAATFTVAGDVRRAFEQAGFALEKREGYGRKREMLTARLARPPAAAPRAPWFAKSSERLSPGAEIAVIGGGVAGASLAHALREVGFIPTIIDPLGIAGGASGNPAGLIMPRLDLGETPAARFFRAAYLHALRVIDNLDAARDHRFFLRCGVELRTVSDEDRARQERILEAELLPTDMMERRADGVFFPQGGVIDPAEYCRRLAGEIELLLVAARSIDEENGGVRVVFSNGESRRFDAAILANGRDALKFFEARTLPLKGVMGQIDYFPDTKAPPHAIAFGPYFAPAPGGGLVVGATYEPLGAEEKPSVRRSATEDNIAAIREAASEFASLLQAEHSTPRASVRCQTPDRLPVVGALPDFDFYGAAYDDLRAGIDRDYAPARFAPHRYILSGLGSRGLVTAPLSAAMIAAELSGAPSPVERDVAEALHPARFFIRDLKRAQRRKRRP